MSSMTKMYLGNLPYSVTTEDVVEFLRLPGDTIVELTKDRETGRPRGFGFVSVAAEDVDRVLTFDGRDLSGRSIRVSVATSRSGGGRGRGARGGPDRGPDRGQDRW